MHFPSERSDCILRNSKFDEDTKARAVKIALVHDLAEAVVGDMTLLDGISSGMVVSIPSFVWLIGL